MRRRSFSLFALILVSGISCAQGKGVVNDPMEAEAVTPGAEAEALAVEEAGEPFADMDMSVEAVLAMDSTEPASVAGTEQAVESEPAAEAADMAMEAETLTDASDITNTNTEAVEAETNSQEAAPKAVPAAAKAATKKISKPRKVAEPKSARVEPQEESVPVVVRDPMEPGPDEEVVASPAPEGAIDEEVAVTDPQPIVSPFEEQVVVLEEEDGKVQEASTGITGFLSQHPLLAMLAAVGLLGGSIFLYWGRNRHQS